MEGKNLKMTTVSGRLYEKIQRIIRFKLKKEDGKE